VAHVAQALVPAASRLRDACPSPAKASRGVGTRQAESLLGIHSLRSKTPEMMEKELLLAIAETESLRHIGRL